ncbi:MAG: hypothetical protein AB1778_05160 [Candidatus Bipolaricaulota bacterium]
MTHAAERSAAAWPGVRAAVRAIRERMGDGQHPLILLVSGVHGIGKTTLCHELSRCLCIRQRVGLGAIVRTLAEFGLPSGAPGSAREMDNDLGLEDPASQLDAQARVLCRVVNRIVATYYGQRVHCVIDGVQLVPQYLDVPPGVLHMHLAVSDVDVYLDQIRRANPHKYGPIGEAKAAVLASLDRALSAAMETSKRTVILRHKPHVECVVRDAIRVIYEQYVQGGARPCSGSV